MGSSHGSKKAFLSHEEEYFESLINVERTQYKPHKALIALHQSLARTRLNRGGYGSGKTRAMCEHLNALCLQYPGAQVLVGRKDLTTLKETTQREYLQTVVSPETISDFNVNDNKLYYKNGSTVLFRETKEPDKVKSLELTAYGIDEADENDTSEIWEKLDDRLRQKIPMNGKRVTPPYAGILTFNPTSDEHWLYELAQRKDISVLDLQSSTYDNIENLPPDYITNLLKKLPPWEVQRLVLGNWGRSIKGKPVYHGFSVDKHVRPIQVNPIWPLYRGWDFGFNRPCVKWFQIDPMTGRVFHLREFLGKEQYLNASHDSKPSVVDEVRRITASLVGEDFPVFDYCDPHGADKKDNALSSVETLRVHYNIHCIYRRERIDTGLEEIQERILGEAPKSPELKDQEPLWIVDPSCKISIAAYCGGYHREETGLPRKDGYYDHPCDVDRYVVVNNLNSRLKSRPRKKYLPRNAVTGY